MLAKKRAMASELLQIRLGLFSYCGFCPCLDWSAPGHELTNAGKRREVRFSFQSSGDALVTPFLCSPNAGSWRA